MEEFLSTEDEFEKDAVLAELRFTQLPSGVTEVLAEIEDIYAGELQNLSGRFTINPEDVDTTLQVIKSERDTMKAAAVQSLTKLSTSLALDAVSTIGAAVALSVDPLVNVSGTVLHTNVSGYRSALEIRKAQEVDDEPLFAYIGPNDDRTRPFCSKVLRANKLYSLEEIKALDEDKDVQLTPVFVYGGGYNCRHRWIYTKRR